MNNSFGFVANGNCNDYIESGKVSEENKILTIPISNSSSVVISTAVREDGEYGNVEKYCLHEMITDESVDFYAE